MHVIYKLTEIFSGPRGCMTTYTNMDEAKEVFRDHNW